MKIATLIAIVGLSTAGAALAQDAPAGGPPSPDARAAVRAACSADMASLCAGKEGREAMMCIRDNSDKVSAGCKDALSKMQRPPAG